MPAVFAFNGIGTNWEIVTVDALSPELQRSVLGRVDKFDRTWSRFRDDSLIAGLARDGDSAEFPPESIALLGLFDRLHEVTGGAVDPLVGRDLELLGYDSDYRLIPAGPHAFQKHRAHGRLRWQHDVRREGSTVSVEGPTLIDVGAAAKGLLVDQLGDLLHDAGIMTSIVDGSGDLRRRGPAPVRIGLQHPTVSSHVVGVIELGDGAALCASSTARRAWGTGLHHIIDGLTGLPVTGIIATWVIAGDALTADGLATALFSTPAERLALHFDFASVRMHVDGYLETWGDLPGEIFHRPKPRHDGPIK